MVIVVVVRGGEEEARAPVRPAGIAVVLDVGYSSEELAMLAMAAAG